jgi:hypothetical protein
VSVPPPTLNSNPWQPLWSVSLSICLSLSGCLSMFFDLGLLLFSLYLYLSLPYSPLPLSHSFTPSLPLARRE